MPGMTTGELHTFLDESVHPMRKLVARGRVELMHDLGDDNAWRDLYRAIACRYTPERGEDPLAVWSKQYYHRST